MSKIHLLSKGGFYSVILNEVKDLILPQSAFADSSLKEGAFEDSSLISPQKHSRIAFLGASALLLVSSPQHLTSSATGGVSVLRPIMTVKIVTAALHRIFFCNVVCKQMR